MQNDSHDESNIPTVQDAASRPNCCSAPKPTTSRAREYVAPRNEVESSIADILAEFLNVQNVGVYDNFILLGGESLLAAQAAWKIRDRFGFEVRLRSILAETVADIAAEISEAIHQQRAGNSDT